MEEIKLVRLAQKGNKVAFETLYNNYSQKLFYYFLSRSRSHEDALDLVSNVILKVLRNIKSFKFKSSFSSWIYSIAKNELTDYYKIISEREISAEEFIENREEEGVKEDNPEILIKVKNILSKLSDKNREVIELRYMFGYSFREIAQALDITENNAIVVHHRALEKARMFDN